MSICAAIFDLDGTILDSMNVWRHCGSDFVRENGCEPENGLSEKLYTMSIAESAAYVKNRYFPARTAEEISEGIQKMLSDSYAHKIALKDGAKETLAFLASRHIPCALATATPEELFRPALTRLGIDGCFCAVLTCPRLGTSKKEPRIYLKAAELLYAAPEETLVFEDALIPIRTAHTAGFLTAGVYDASCGTDAAEIKKYSSFYFSSLAEFPAAVQSGNIRLNAGGSLCAQH